MNTRRVLTALVLAGAAFGYGTASAALAQYTSGDTSGGYTPGYGYQAPPVPQYIPPAPQMLDPQQLDQLLGPIALYPDPLLSEVLAAATYPQDVAAAQQWLQYFPNPSEEDINQQPWDDSVKALVHYPPVLSMLANSAAWTAQLGAAFVNQQQDVMDSVQRLRQQALAANTLGSTPQQQVLNDNGTIEILPAAPNVIYVPQYDPGTVYVVHPNYYRRWITFGPAFGAGAWLDLGWDWHARHIDRGVRWGHDWRHPDRDHAREWHHNPARPFPQPGYFPGHGGEPRHDEDWNRSRGWENEHRPGPAFDERGEHRGDEHENRGGRNEREQRGNERPVMGLPEHQQPAPARTPERGVGAPGRTEEHRNVPERGPAPGRAEVPGRGQPPAHVQAPPRVPTPPPQFGTPTRAPGAHPQGPRVYAPQPAPAPHPRPRPNNERPVQGIPRGGMSAPPDRALAANAAAQRAQAPRGGQGHGGGAPAFQDGAGAGPQSARGHGSMRR